VTDQTQRPDELVPSGLGAAEENHVATIDHLLDSAVSTRPDHPAVTDSEGSLSYAELDLLARRHQAALTAAGVFAGDRIVVTALSDRHTVALVFAAARAGVICVPVHVDLQVAQLVQIAGNAEAAIVLAQDPSDELRHEVGGVVDRSTWCAELPSSTTAAGPVGKRPEPALLLYTSGTTSAPKGVVCPHDSILAATDSIGQVLGYRADDVVLVRLPLAFDYGLYQIFLTVAAGATLLLAGREADTSLIELIVENEVTVAPLVPSLAQMLLMLTGGRAVDSRLRLVTNTGARMGESTWRDILAAFPGARYASMYGMTECKRISILHPHELAERPTSVGRPIPGNTVRIIDENGAMLPPHEIGDIVVRGRTMMSGYWQVPLDRQRQYVAYDGGLELHTGDQGWLDEDGYLYFSGRDDDIVKRHGIRVSLTEIEAAAERVDGVDAAVVLKPGADGRMVLCVVGTRPTDEIRDELARTLDPARRPTNIRIVERIPLTRNGKPDRKALDAAVKSIDHKEKNNGHELRAVAG
jgi:acyl-coenzyme A synthetase/AMP-(fatty) acid ligase